MQSKGLEGLNSLIFIVMVKITWNLLHFSLNSSAFPITVIPLYAGFKKNKLNSQKQRYQSEIICHSYYLHLI